MKPYWRENSNFKIRFVQDFPFSFLRQTWFDRFWSVMQCPCTVCVCIEAAVVNWDPPGRSCPTALKRAPKRLRTHNGAKTQFLSLNSIMLKLKYLDFHTKNAQFIGEKSLIFIFFAPKNQKNWFCLKLKNLNFRAKNQNSILLKTQIFEFSR